MVHVIKQNVIARKISLLEGRCSAPLIQNNEFMEAEGVYLEQFQQITQKFDHEKVLLATIFAGQAECVIKTATQELNIPLAAGDIVLAHGIQGFTISNPMPQEFIASLCWPVAH